MRSLTAYLSAYPIVTALKLFAEGNHTVARDTAMQGLARLPVNESLIIMVSACDIYLGEYLAAQTALAQLSESSFAKWPENRAVIANNLALAIWLHGVNIPNHEESMTRADALSNLAYSLYPCTLAYRSTRSLLLTATNRADDALALLQYSNYSRGSGAERGDRQFARAFALHRLDRQEESNTALDEGLMLNKAPSRFLTRIGLLPRTPA